VSDWPRRIDVRHVAPKDLSDVIRHLRADGPIAYPTETVYGLGGVASAPAASRVRALKGRDGDKPLIVLVASRRAVEGLRWTPVAETLADAFWPGPLTLVLRDPDRVFPEEVGGGTGTVGLRVSPHPLVARLLADLDASLTSTSLNLAGEAPALTGEAARGAVRRMDGRDVLVLDAGELPAASPSTVVDCTGGEPVVLREGSVSVARLRGVVPEIHGRQTA